jgi:hypothetical protein
VAQPLQAPCLALHCSSSSSPCLLRTRPPSCLTPPHLSLAQSTHLALPSIALPAFLCLPAGYAGGLHSGPPAGALHVLQGVHVRRHAVSHDQLGKRLPESSWQLGLQGQEGCGRVTGVLAGAGGLWQASDCCVLLVASVLCRGSMLERSHSVRRAKQSTLCGLLSSQGGQRSWQACLPQRLNPHRPARASAGGQGRKSSATAMAAETCQCCAALSGAVSVECPSQLPSPRRLLLDTLPCLQLLPPQPAPEGCGAQRADL